MRQLSRNILLWLILLSAGAAFCQKTWNPFANQIIEVQTFETAHGLVNRNIYDLLVDKTGYLWVATAEGLLRYDGYGFRLFSHVAGDSTSLAHNSILKILEAKNGDLWLAHVRGGVSRYDRATGRFHNFPFTKKLQPTTAPVHNIFFDSKNRLWATVKFNGICELNPTTGEFRRFDILTRQNSPNLSEHLLSYYNHGYYFFEEESGKIWVSTVYDLHRFDPETGIVEAQRQDKDLSPREKRTDQAYKILPDGDLLWVGGWESGLRCLNRKTGVWRQWLYNPVSNPMEIKNLVIDIAEKSADELWIASSDKGLGVFSKKTAQFFWLSDTPPGEFHDILKKDVGRILPDQQGNFWVVAGGKLVRMRLKNKQFRFHPVESKELMNIGHFDISCFLDDHTGRFLLLGSNWGDGLFVLDRRTGRTSTHSFEIPKNSQESVRQVRDLVQARDGTIWVLTRHTLLRFDTQKMALEKPVQPTIFYEKGISNYYTRMAEDAAGNLWFGTSASGVIRFNPRTGETRQFLPDEKNPYSIPTDIVGIINADGRGRIWFGCRDKTAFGYFDAASERFFYLDGEGKPTFDRTTLRINNYFVADGGNSIWACTEDGILIFDCRGEQPVFLKKITTRDGLPSNNVISGSTDAAGNFWCTTTAGLCRMDMKASRCTIFGKNEGMDYGLTGLPFFSKTEQRMLLPTFDGYVSFDPAAMALEKTIAPLVLTSFKIDGTEHYYGSLAVPPAPLEVPAESQFFSLEFAALDLARADELEYEYRLEGFDNQWIKSSEQRTVNYANIPAGRYFLKIKLAGAPEAEALAVPLRVKVFFYKAGWFWALVAALVAGAAFRFFQIRQRQKQQVQELKNKTQLLEKEKAVVMYESLKQQLNPHFLFNSLTSLGSLIQIEPKTAVSFLENLSKTYRYILKSSERETVPLGEEMKFAEAFVRLQQTRFESGFEVRFEVPDEFFHRKIVPVTLQNLIENAIKHNIIDEESPLVVEVFVADDCLVVRNNLQRKKFVETSNRKGLANLQSFYKYLSDRPILTSEEGGFFTIQIPLI